MMLQKIAGGNKHGNRADINLIKDVKVLRLVILGKNELFGLEEIMENQKLRTKTIECTSEGKCYYLSKEYFIHCVNLFKFS